MDDKTHRPDHDPAPFSPPSAPWSPSPGKRSMTQGLAPRPIVYRVESLAAAHAHAFGPRDDNGVAAQADAAVDRAAASTGEPLRDDLRARFEGSLGADLSAVRVHRSADSAIANQAVGAKAYTIGNDIHFGAGNYQPDDPFGLHLLAHEVAHTVQQQGVAAHRQHKLEVSTPHDAAEAEADRAADAMVAGAPARVSAAPAGIARAAAGGVDRTDREDYKLGRQLSPEDIRRAEEEAAASARRQYVADIAPEPWVSMTGSVEEDATGAWGAAPQFVGRLDYPEVTPVCDALRADWATVQQSWNATAALTAAFKTKEVAAEAQMPGVQHGAIPAKADDAMLSPSQIPVGDAFIRSDGKGDGALFMNDKLDYKKLDQKADKGPYVTQQVACKTADLELSQARGSMRNASGGVIAASIGVQMAASQVAIELEKAQVPALEKKKELWEDGKNLVVGLASGIVKVAVGLAMNKSESTYEGFGKLGEVLIGASFDGPIYGIKAQMREIQEQINRLTLGQAQLSVSAAVVTLSTAMNAVEAAQIEITKKEMARVEQYRKLADLQKDLTKKLGGSAANQEVAYTAVRAVPLIQEVIGQAQEIAGAARLPGDSKLSSKGFAICSNRDDLIHHAAILKGTKVKYDKVRAAWQRRLDSVQALMDKTASY